MKLKTIFILLISILLTSCASDNPSKRSNHTNIAILMPLTGANAPMGQAAATMIELGLEDGLEGNIKIMTYDVADKEKIDMSVSRLKARGTSIVLGPIFSSNSSDIAAKITPGITMISLSNDPGLAQNGVYVFGHSPIKQTDRIINYMLDNGYKDYIVLLPAGKYSQELSQIIDNIITSKAGKLAHSEFYTSREESIEVAVDNISKIVQNINELDYTTNKPVLYISDESVALEKLIAALKKHNLDVSTVIIGDNKIDIENKGSISYLFTGSLEYDAKDLLSRISTRLPQKKHLNYMDLMAYDLGRITAYNIGQGLGMTQFIQRLDSGHLYNGSSGYMKFIDHIADRKYDIIKYEGGAYEIVSSGK